MPVGSEIVIQYHPSTCLVVICMSSCCAHQFSSGFSQLKNYAVSCWIEIEIDASYYISTIFEVIHTPTDMNGRMIRTKCTSFILARKPCRPTPVLKKKSILYTCKWCHIITCVMSHSFSRQNVYDNFGGKMILRHT